MSLAQSIPAPVSYRVDDSNSIRFRRIGLDLWSLFCEHIKENRVAEISSLSLNDGAKGDLFKGLIGSGIDMDAMLSEAATMAGMCWIINRCCLDEVKEADLMRVIPLLEVPELFKRLADVEQGEGEPEGESGGN